MLETTFALAVHCELQSVDEGCRIATVSVQYNRFLLLLILSHEQFTDMAHVDFMVF